MPPRQSARSVSCTCPSMWSRPPGSWLSTKLKSSLSRLGLGLRRGLGLGLVSGVLELLLRLGARLGAMLLPTLVWSGAQLVAPAVPQLSQLATHHVYAVVAAAVPLEAHAQICARQEFVWVDRRPRAAATRTAGGRTATAGNSRVEASDPGNSRVASDSRVGVSVSRVSVTNIRSVQPRLSLDGQVRTPPPRRRKVRASSISAITKATV